MTTANGRQHHADTAAARVSVDDALILGLTLRLLLEGNNVADFDEQLAFARCGFVTCP